MRKLIRQTVLRREKLGNLPRSSLYDIRKNDPTFPKPVLLSEKTVAYYEDEIDAWLESKRQVEAAA